NYPAFVYSGTETIAHDFANFNISTTLAGSISGVVYDDNNGNGLLDTSETGIAGWTVFIDANANRILDPTELQTTTDADGNYTISGVLPGSVSLVIQSASSWRLTSPVSGSQAITLKNGEARKGVNFGAQKLRDSSIDGTIFADANDDGLFGAGEHGLAGITVYLDLNEDGVFDPTEPSTVTSEDLYYTPDVNEAGRYSFTHLAVGSYQVRQIVPDTLSLTPAIERVQTVTISSAEHRSGINFADVYRLNEIHGTKFDDVNGNHLYDVGEPVIAGATVYLDLNRNDVLDVDEPKTVTQGDGTYTFLGLMPGAYVVREILEAGFEHSTPGTGGGVLWPDGVSNPAVGDVTPNSIEIALGEGESYSQTISLTLPAGSALTNAVDVFLLFDDTGSFVNNSPIVRAAFPDIINQLQLSLPGNDLAFGVGRFEEYANFAGEYSTGRPFVLNQPIVSTGTTGYMAAIQAALNRTTPGYGGDQPETDIEALYQLVTGAGFDGNNNGSVLDSGAAGLASTQTNPGNSGDVPSFASFTADPSASVLGASGTIGGAGFRAGALPVILLATDTGFAFQPQVETTVTGIDGLTLPVSQLTGTSRNTTPFSAGAGLQETITGLNALGALVIGLGTNAQDTLDPRQGLEALAMLTGAVNRSTTTIANGTTNPIAPGDPLYFQIASGFASSVASGVINAIQNAVTNVAVNVTVQASDPRVHIINHTGTINGLTSGTTASFDIEFTGDGIPHRFDLQFVREGTNVVLGSIPVVLGAAIPGEGYQFCDLEEGEIEVERDFSDVMSTAAPVNLAPTFTAGADQVVAEDSGVQTVTSWASNISPGDASEASQRIDFQIINSNPSLFRQQPMISADGTLTFESAPDAFGSATLTIVLHDDGGTANGGVDTSSPATITITINPINDAPVATADTWTLNQGETLTVPASGVLANDIDVEGDLLSARVTVNPLHGTVSLSSDGQFTYTPDPAFSGDDYFTYIANDGTDDSAPAEVHLIVNPVNFAPIARDDSFETREGVELNISSPGILLNDSDANDDPLTAAVVAGPANGVLTWNADGSFRYSANPGFSGVDSFTYQANDGALNSGVATVSITIIANAAPVASGDSYSTNENVALVVPAPGVLSNDSDADGDSISATIVTLPGHGSLTWAADGAFTYTPDAGFSGSDSFTYQVSDGLKTSNIATVSLAVQHVNVAPTAVNDKYDLFEDIPLTVSAPGLLSNDIDPEGDVLSANVLTNPAHGTLSWSSDGSFTYVPDLNYHGSDSFTYQVSDGLAASNVAMVVLNVAAVNDPPEAVNDSYTTDEDMTLVANAPGLLLNDSDLDGDLLSIRVTAGPSHGSLTWQSDGSFQYTPDLNYFGPDEFFYVVSDGVNESTPTTVSLTVQPVNDAPVGMNDQYTMDAGAVLEVTAPGVLQNDLDVEGDTLASRVVQAPVNGVLTLNSDGSFSYTPSEGFSGTDSFTYVATDGSLESAPVTVDITVNTILPPPVDGNVHFYVVDASRRSVFEYDTDGTDLSQNRLNKEDKSPRGIATNSDGTIFWILDSKGEVFVYDKENQLLGSWEIHNVDKPEGIVLSGNDLLVVDRSTRRVYTFADAASLRSGQASPATSFRLNRFNRSAQDLATDGDLIWIIDRSRVFVYNTQGKHLGVWKLDATNNRPTGIAVAPDGSGDLWIADAAADKVFVYKGATANRTGQYSQDGSFELNSRNVNAIGLAVASPVTPTTIPETLITSTSSSVVRKSGLLESIMSRFAISSPVEGAKNENTAETHSSVLSIVSRTETEEHSEVLALNELAESIPTVLWGF
ncbi:MAG: tandem-95 repeat protein, partial [Planctomycetaceae bacterium]|nr:tandem-95 repeat protein [Planctomycetaceae bacterium]